MFEWIFSSSVLLAVLIAVRYLFRGKISCRLQYALWLLAALRLLVPGAVFESRASVLNALPAIPETYEAMEAAPRVETDTPISVFTLEPGQSEQATLEEVLPDAEPALRQEARTEPQAERKISWARIAITS